MAHPAEKLTHSRVVVWTPLMQAAWDELYGGFGKPLKVETPNPLMDLLDRFEWKAESVMPPGHWKVWAGEGTEELVKKANAEAAQMTRGGEGSVHDQAERGQPDCAGVAGSESGVSAGAASIRGVATDVSGGGWNEVRGAVFRRAGRWIAVVSGDGEDPSV